MGEGAARRYARVLTSRKAIGGTAGLLGLGLIALIILAAVGFNGTTTQKLKVLDCSASTPGCALRQPAHFHADFALFINGTQFSFDKPQFISEDNDLIAADVHIHAPRYTVVHVHYTNTTWARFFQTLGFELSDPSVSGVTQACLTMPSGEKFCDGGGNTFKFIVNGMQVKGIGATNIGDMDRVLISYGSESIQQVMASQWTKVTDQACIPDERCKSRIPPNEPPEQCSVSNTGGCAVTG